MAIVRLVSIGGLVLALAIGCGRTDMETQVRTAGGGGAAMVGADAGGTTPVSTSGPCGDATCLTLLFETCIPSGICTTQGGSSPSASYNQTCYANGVTVFRMGTYSTPGSTNPTDTLTVQRNGVICFRIETYRPDLTVSGSSFVVKDRNGTTIATGETANKSERLLAVTCRGGEPTLVKSACLDPGDDSSACTAGVCQ